MSAATCLECEALCFSAADLTRSICAAYFKVSDYLEDDGEAATKLLKFTGSWKYRAQILNKLCLDRNISTHAVNFATLEDMAARPAEIIKDYPEIRSREVVAAGGVDGFYCGGRQLLLEVKSLLSSVFECAKERASQAWIAHTDTEAFVQDNSLSSGMDEWVDAFYDSYYNLPCDYHPNLVVPHAWDEMSCMTIPILRPCLCTISSVSCILSQLRSAAKAFACNPSHPNLCLKKGVFWSKTAYCGQCCSSKMDDFSKEEGFEMCAFDR